MVAKGWFWAALPVAVGVAVLVAAPIMLPTWRGAVFVVVDALMLFELIVLGWLVNGRPAGAFVDNRNRLSLSKLQAAAWTAVVLSGFATAAAYNIAASMWADGPVGALAVAIPGELLLAMGISATSLVATPALLAIKSDQREGGAKIEDVRAKLNDPTLSHVGKVLVRATPADASWSDIVTGEEVGNAGSPDLGKIQQAGITILLLGCYAAYVYADLAGSQEVIRSLPALDESFVWLLGISHASYLAYKAAPHTT